MQHPFEILEPELAHQIAAARILPSREKELAQVCEGLLENEEIYQELSDATPNKIPAAVLMAMAQREMNGNVHCFLGNGQALSRRTTIVPKGLGPWLQSWPQNFLIAGVQAVSIDGLDKVIDWTLPRAAFETEALNGFGYRSHGIPSPYVFGGTSIQQPGKYVADGVFDPEVMDEQLGTLAIMEELFKLNPKLVFAEQDEKVEDASPIVPAAPPIGAGGEINVFLLQQKLNALNVPGTPLLVDGNYGRATRQVVRSYQFLNHLQVDGLVGPKTIASLKI